MDNNYFSKIEEKIEQRAIRDSQIEKIRDGIKAHLSDEQKLGVVFLCTHNSRRSQFSEFLSRELVHYFSLKNIELYSAGVEVTAVHKNVELTLIEKGYHVTRNQEMMGAQQSLDYALEKNMYSLFSKTTDHDSLPESNFITIAVCDHAAQTCPMMPGSSGRFSLPFTDPGSHDKTDDALSHYKNTCDEIADGLFRLFKGL